MSRVGIVFLGVPLLCAADYSDLTRPVPPPAEAESGVQPELPPEATDVASERYAITVDSGSILRGRRMEDPGCYGADGRMFWETLIVQNVTGTLSRHRPGEPAVHCSFHFDTLKAERSALLGSYAPTVHTDFLPYQGLVLEPSCPLDHPFSGGLSMTATGIAVDDVVVFRQGALVDAGVMRHRRGDEAPCDSTFWWVYPLATDEVMLSAR